MVAIKYDDNGRVSVIVDAVEQLVNTDGYTFADMPEIPDGFNYALYYLDNQLVFKEITE